MLLLRNQIWVCSQCLLQVPSRESRQLLLKRLKLSKHFQGKVVKDRVKEKVCGVCHQLTGLLLIGWW